MTEKENIRNQMDSIYGNMPPEKIPWNLFDPPSQLVDLVENKFFDPCKTIDLGCGAGNYSVWLAKRGFDVTGIDISKKAIALAKDLAKNESVDCKFAAIDLLGDMKQFHEEFNFALEWEVMHHIFPEDRSKYLKNVYNVLKESGRYLSVCFSEKDPDFGGAGKYRKTPLDTTLYFSSEDELKELFEPFFNIIELKTIEIKGKYGPHMANYAWLERK